MISRKSQDLPPTQLPKSWREKVESLLTSIYESSLDLQSQAFEVHGLTYPDEIILTASLINTKDELKAPVTFQISADLEQGIKPEKTFDILIDAIGIFFDKFFNETNTEQSQYISRWQEDQFRKQKIFYRVTRENITLSLMADELLDKEGFED